MELSQLNNRELKALVDLHAAWKAAREEKDFGGADKLRAELIARGVSGRGLDLWHPVFESCESRVNRAADRYVYGEQT